MDRFVYKGWVPTVSGRLSFEVVGSTSDHLEPTVFVNEADAESRYFVCYQLRDGIDSALPFKKLLTKHLYHLSGELYYVCVAKAPSSIHMIESNLDGKIYIFHKSQWKNVCDSIHAAQTKLMKFVGQEDAENLDTYFSGDYTALMAALAKHTWFCVEFSLKRSGVAEIVPAPQQPSPEGAPELPAGPLGDRLRHIVCAQLFFFLKDIVHRHQHHDPSTDTMLDVYRVNNDGRIDDSTWRLETLRLLYRAVLRYKRAKKEIVFSSALGILAYIRSFKNIYEMEVPTGSPGSVRDIRQFPGLNDNLIEESIRASQIAVKNSNDTLATVQEKVRNIILGTVGIFISLLGLLQLSTFRVDEKELHWLLSGSAKFVLTSPLITFAIIVCAVIVLLLVSGVVNPKEFVIIRNALRLYQGRKRKRNIIICFVLSFIVITLVLLFALSPNPNKYNDTIGNRDNATTGQPTGVKDYPADTKFGIYDNGASSKDMKKTLPKKPGSDSKRKP